MSTGNQQSSQPPPLESVNPRDYFLSDQENRDIFNKLILPIEFRDLEQHGHRLLQDGLQPVCVLIGGQTGAGKTRTAPELAKALAGANRRFAHFIADTYKTFHPKYEQLIREKPSLASRAAGYDARKWLALACETAIGLSLDCVVESACRNPEDFISLAEAFSTARYRVLVVLLAVHESQSRLGVLVRYYSDLPEARSRGLPLRLTPRNVHDESYHGLAKVADFIDSSKAATKVVVVRRGNFVGYSNQRGSNGEWNEAPAAQVSLERERRRAKVETEIAAFTQDIESLRQAHPDRDSELREIEDMFNTIQASGADAAPDSPLLELDCAEFLAS